MKFDEKLREECAVFGVCVSTNEAAGITYNALLALQHRGQEGSGIAVLKGNNILYHKNVGLVSEVFHEKVLKKLPMSHLAVGHNRYSTTGSNTVHNVQPFITEYLTGRIATAHNGNITNARKIKEELKNLGVHFEATSDSEVVSSLIAYYIVKLGDPLSGVIKAAKQLEGAFSLVVLCGDGKIIAVRDGSGIRPLCIGTHEDGVCVASETCALDSCGFTMLRDVAPGEVVVMENGQITHSSIELQEQKGCGLCIFEYVYFARPDSIIDNLSVYEARYNMGRVLAEEHPVDADVVCGVPDSGLEAAIGYSAASGIPLVSGFVKNRYIGRSFIYPSQAQREDAVRLKLNPLSANVRGKRIVMVDDSIVRGTTSKKIVQAMKNAGAKEVHMRISSPPFLFSCHFGTDIDSEENLIANRMTLEEIRG
ncbi:MAG: amidophosphoribosyltransferase, partial [Oscillospiraceae bacterium]|nr:amidophosphoribosyltransferase [Oscillospiraceae bacterium]